jgi:hypothetical protein
MLCRQMCNKLSESENRRVELDRSSPLIQSTGRKPMQQRVFDRDTSPTDDSKQSCKVSELGSLSKRMGWQLSHISESKLTRARIASLSAGGS